MTMFPKPTRADRKARRAARLLNRRLSIGQLRNAAIARALGRCEAPDCRRGGVGLEMDHWLGGIGRRRQHETIENVWMLCSECSFARTRNSPSAAYWNDLFKRHCEAHKYPAPTLHMERALHHR